MEVAISDENAMVTGKTGDTALAYQTAQALNATRMRILVEWARVSDADRATPAANPITTGARSTARSTWRRRMEYVPRLPWPDRRRPTTRTPGVSRSRFGTRSHSLHRVCARCRPAFPGPGGPVLDLERAQLPGMARAPEPVPTDVSRAISGGYDAIKSVDPSAQVLIGETVPYGGKVVIKSKVKGKRGQQAKSSARGEDGTSNGRR